MRAGELQRLGERERETESVDQSEAERDEPPPIQLRTEDVLEGHEHDRERDEGLDEWREPERVGRQAERGGDQGDRMRHGERSDDGHERPEAPEGHDQTEEEEEVVDAVQNVLEAESHK